MLSYREILKPSCLARLNVSWVLMTLLNPKCKQHQPHQSDYLAYNIFAAIQAVHESFWVAYTQFIHPLALSVVHVFAQCQARPVSGRDIWSRVGVHWLP